MSASIHERLAKLEERVMSHTHSISMLSGILSEKKEQAETGSEGPSPTDAKTPSRPVSALCIVDVEGAAVEIVDTGVTPPMSSGGRHYEVSCVAEILRRHERPIDRDYLRDAIMQAARTGQPVADAALAELARQMNTETHGPAVSVPNGPHQPRPQAGEVPATTTTTREERIAALWRAWNDGAPDGTAVQAMNRIHDAASRMFARPVVTEAMRDALDAAVLALCAEGADRQRLTLELINKARWETVMLDMDHVLVEKGELERLRYIQKAYNDWLVSDEASRVFTSVCDERDQWQRDGVRMENERDAARREVEELKARLRTVCRALVNAAGSDCPMNAEDAADRFVKQRDALQAKLDAAAKVTDEDGAQACMDAYDMPDKSLLKMKWVPVFRAARSLLTPQVKP